MSKAFYPTWHLMRKPLEGIALLLGGLGAGLIVCTTYYVGISLIIIKVALLPLAMAELLLLIMFWSLKIKITEEAIVFFQFFLPVRRIQLVDIKSISYERISEHGRWNVLTLRSPRSKYCFPVKLFSQEDINCIIRTLSSN